MEDDSIESVPSEELDDIGLLHRRIAALQEKPNPDGVGGSQAFHLVFSLGFVVVTVVLMGAFGGRWLAERFAMPGLSLGVLLLSVGLAVISVYKLLRPFMGK